MRCSRFFAVLLCLAVLGCRQETAPNATSDHSDTSGTLQATSDSVASADKAADGVIELDALTLTAPGNWVRKPAASSFVLAEFTLAHSEGDDADGRITVSTAGGSVEANIDRWKGQFQPQPTASSQEDIDVAGLKVTVIDLTGVFNDQRGPFAPGEQRPGYRMIAAVIPVNGQLHFVKATGPQKTIESHADAIHEFIHSARPMD